MTPDQKHVVAANLLLKHYQDPEYSLVYEDEELFTVPEDQQQEIHRLMCSAKVTITFPNHDYQYGEPL